MCTVSLHTLRRTNRPLSAIFLFAADAGATTLDEVWVANRVPLVKEILDWLCEPDRMPGGHAYLNEATYSRALDLLAKAAASLLRTGSKKTTRDHIGSPACWAILLAQQAHYLEHGWEMSPDAACKRWNVQAMHMALVSAQGQRLNREGGSSSTAQTSTPRGLNGAQQVRAPRAPSPPCKRHQLTPRPSHRWWTRATVRMRSPFGSTLWAMTMTSRRRWSPYATTLYTP